MKQRKKSVLIVFILFLALIAPARIVRADMGPKPTITVDLENPPEEYFYIDLLEHVGENYSRHDSLTEAKEVEGDTQKDIKIKEMMLEYYEDGWAPRLDRGIVDSVFHPKNEENSYGFDYSVPDTFRVIIVTESGKIYTSDVVTVEQFNARCIYDVESGSLAEDTAGGMIAGITQVLVCYVITILIEGGLLLVFGLFCRRNLVRFFVVNTLTQLFLQMYLRYRALMYGTGISFLFIFFLLELGIAVFETCCYAGRLISKDEAPHKGKNIAYALVANACSFLPGRLILLFLPL